MVVPHPTFATVWLPPAEKLPAAHCTHDPLDARPKPGRHTASGDGSALSAAACLPEVWGAPYLTSSPTNTPVPSCEHSRVHLSAQSAPVFSVVVPLLHGVQLARGAWAVALRDQVPRGQGEHEGPPLPATQGAASTHGVAVVGGGGGRGGQCEVACLLDGGVQSPSEGTYEGV